MCLVSLKLWPVGQTQGSGSDVLSFSVNFFYTVQGKKTKEETPSGVRGEVKTC